jgi:hypothetical protein
MTRESRREKSVAEGIAHNPVNAATDFFPSLAFGKRRWRAADALPKAGAEKS